MQLDIADEQQLLRLKSKLQEIIPAGPTPQAFPIPALAAGGGSALRLAEP